jgi:hypothetical protein
MWARYRVKAISLVSGSQLPSMGRDPYEVSPWRSPVEQIPYSGAKATEYIEPLTLVDQAGDKVGDIVEVNPDFLVVRRGHLLGQQELYFIPRSEVTEAADVDWQLAIGKDELGSTAWGQPPAQSKWTADTYRAGMEERFDAVGRTTIRLYDDELQATTHHEAGEDDTLEVPAAGRSVNG